jgi:hypothetical protein
MRRQHRVLQEQVPPGPSLLTKLHYCGPGLLHGLEALHSLCNTVPRLCSHKAVEVGVYTRMREV